MIDILYISLSIGFLILVGFLSFVFFELGSLLKETRGNVTELNKTIKKANNILYDIQDIIKDIKQVKDGIKKGVSLVNLFISNFLP